MNNIKDDRYYLLKIKNDILAIDDYVKGLSMEEFLTRIQVIDSCMFRLIQISENIKSLSDEFKINHNPKLWFKIVGFRNRIVHDYGSTDYSIVAEIVFKRLSELKQIIEENI